MFYVVFSIFLFLTTTMYVTIAFGHIILFLDPFSNPDINELI